MPVNRLGKEQDRVAMAAQLCSCVFEGNLPLLRRLVSAGAPPDAGDYDKRTALHIAACESNTAAVRSLSGLAGGVDIHLSAFTVNTASKRPSSSALAQ